MAAKEAAANGGEGRQMRVAVLTISDLGAVGQRADTSGDAIVDWASERGYEVVVRSVVADETDRIAGKLARWADSGEVDVVLTTGGTGLTERDVTPEATAAILEREAQGIAEAIRAASGPGFPRAWLSRGRAGTRGETLIIHLPGSTHGGKEGFSVWAVCLYPAGCGGPGTTPAPPPTPPPPEGGGGRGVRTHGGQGV